MTERPHLLLIMVDQWRGDALGVAGHPVVRTPYLDAMAASGARFTRAYSATPTCIPARAALMTGQRQSTHGRVGYQDHVPWNYPTTLASELSRGGYQTRAVGKMHVFPERSLLGFDDVVLHSPLGIVRSAMRRGLAPERVDDYLPWLQRRHGAGATFYDHGLDSNSWVARPWDKPEACHPTTFVADQAIDVLRRRDDRKPLFLFASFNAPHPPYDPPGWAFEQYRDAAMPAPPVGDWADAFADLDAPATSTAFRARIRDDDLRRARAGYFGHMTHIDHQINRLLEQLQHYGMADHTVVMFVSDHGEMLGDHLLFRKGFPYEGSARIPMLMTGPGVPSGQVDDSHVTELRDVMPTLLDCAGLPIPPTVEGRSILSLFGSDPSRWRSELHGEHTLAGQSLQWMTDGQEKYVWLSGTGREQLFDLRADPQECHDLAGEPTVGDRLARWRKQLTERLSGREEGYVDDGRLVPGRTPRTVLQHPTAPTPPRPVG